MVFSRLQLAGAAGAFFAAALTVMREGAAWAQDGGTLAKIKSSGAITIGHREASFGFSYLDATLKPIGYSIDICKRIVGRSRPNSRCRPSSCAAHGEPIVDVPQGRPAVQGGGRPGGRWHDEIGRDGKALGEMEKLYHQWFMSPIPPKNININYPLNAETKDAFANPSAKGI